MRPNNGKMAEKSSRDGNQRPLSSQPPIEQRSSPQRSNVSPLSDRGRTLRSTKTKQLLSRKPGRSKLPHDAPMGKGHIYFSLDCEMVGVGPKGAESALARVVVVNWDREVVLDTFVKPTVPVTDYRTFVSGVRREDLESDWAMPLEDCRAEVSSVLRGKILIGHGLQNDLDAIGMTHPWCDTRDTTTYAPFMRTCIVDDKRVLRPRKLRELAYEELSTQIQADSESHCPIEDATAALDLYKSARMEWEKVIMDQVNAARESEAPAQPKKPRQKPRRVAQPRNNRRKAAHQNPGPISPPRSYSRQAVHLNRSNMGSSPYSQYDAGSALLFHQPVMQQQMQQHHQYGSGDMWSSGWHSSYGVAPCQPVNALKWNNGPDSLGIHVTPIAHRVNN